MSSTTTPTTGQKIGSELYSGAAIFGRVQAVIGAAFAMLIVAIMIMIGIHNLHDPHTAVAAMTVTAVTSCAQQTDPQSGAPSGYACVVNVSFTANGKSYTASGVTVTVPAQTVVGATINLRYDPNNPTSVVQESSPRALGWGLIGGGIVLGAAAVGFAVLTFKSKGFAAATGAAEIVGHVL